MIFLTKNLVLKCEFLKFNGQFFTQASNLKNGFQSFLWTQDKQYFYLKVDEKNEGK